MFWISPRTIANMQDQEDLRKQAESLITLLNVHGYINLIEDGSISQFIFKNSNIIVAFAASDSLFEGFLEETCD